MATTPRSLSTKKKANAGKKNLDISDIPVAPHEYMKEQKSYAKFVPFILKRDGRKVPFDFNKIVTAIFKAMTQTGEGSKEEAAMVAHKVAADVVRISKKYKDFVPEVEGLQDTVEKELILNEYVSTAKAYILYRNERAKLRKQKVEIPEHVKKLADESAKYFKDNPLGEFVYLRTYAKWIHEENRRETWIETVDRYMKFMKEKLGNKLTEAEYTEVREGILKQEALPSMRLLQFAGPAAKKCNVCVYNCSFLAPTQLKDFSEAMYVSMCGSGVGYSVETVFVQQLPQIKMQTGKKLAKYVVPDTREGWCDALLTGMEAWFGGSDVEFDYSKIRPAGARLKTMGGKASGPGPLISLMNFTRERVLSKQGRRLSNLDVHDIMCKIGECVVAGGVRRTALISLSDLDDREMRDAKKGTFYYTQPQRSMANNSAVYENKPTNAEFLSEWVSLMESQTGERGMYYRGGLMTQLPKRRIELLKKKYKDDPMYGPIGKLGMNPCGEIILQPKQFCNLSEIVARKTDTIASLKKKIRLATIIGTYQATLTNFNYLSEDWKNNCETESLLGVSISGQWDSEVVRDPKVLDMLREEADKVNQVYAKRFGINRSTAITCTKPSGNTSQMVNCASGLHPRHSPYYIRRIRISATDSLLKMLKDQGVPYHPEVGQNKDTATTYVLEFPVKSPEGSVYKDDLTAIQQLEHWKVVKTHFTNHNPSATISVGDSEWIAVANWLYENWEIIGGLSFLPRFEHAYQLAPYESITKERYEQLAEQFKKVDYSQLVLYEIQDETEMKKELACVGGTCEIA